MPFEQPDGFEAMATRVVGEAEEVIGLSSVRAVVGNGEKIREVVGFAAIRRALVTPSGQMSQLLPIDSQHHWFVGSDVALRPDLLQLTLEVRPDDIPLVHAILLECKFAQKNQAHLAKANEQIQEGLHHLTSLLAPERGDLRRLGFDRRYWWAQLHRAITSRSVVNLADQEWKQLDHALESLAEGQFEIHWQAAIFTFWTNEAGPQPEVISLALPVGTVQPPFEVPEDFAIQHIALGYQGVSALFAEAKPLPLIELKGSSIRLRPEQDSGKVLTGAATPPPTSDTKESSMETDASAERMAVSAPAVDHKNQVTAPAGVQAPPTSMNAQPEQPHVATESSPVPTSATLELPESTSEASTTPKTPLASTTGQVVAVDMSPIPEKILLGNRGNNDPVYWHFGHPQLENRHLLIFGTSGSGKTYGIQCLLAEMARQQLHSLIIDYTDGFLPQRAEPEFAEIAKPRSHFVRLDKIPLSPFRRQIRVIDPTRDPISENSYDVADRVANIFTSIFKTMGDQQRAALVRVLETGIETNPEFKLEDMVARLREEGPNGESLANKVEPLVKARPFKEGQESAWGSLLTELDCWVQILQLTGMSSDTQKMVTEFALWDLWDYVLNAGSKNIPIPIVLDEIQNLDHNDGSPIDKMLREGRKFGLALILATQTMSEFNKKQKDRLFLATHKLFFKPTDSETSDYAQLLYETTGEPKNDWIQRLNRLEKGQCWSVGPVLTSSGNLKKRAILVNVTSLGQRSFEG
jgi:DNA phosphorothioation-dependent restriction protein DptH